MNITISFEDEKGTPLAAFLLDNNTAKMLCQALELKEKVDNKFGDYNSLHEAYGVIKEEMFEFEQHVFLKQSKRRQEDINSELVDLISCCLRVANVDISR